MQHFPTPPLRGLAGRIERAQPRARRRQTAISRIGGRALSLIIAAFIAIALPYGGNAMAQGGTDLTRGEVREVQTTLKDLGYDAGPSDGLMGPRTRSAIQAFRAANGFETDADVTQQLLRRVRAAAAPESGTEEAADADRRSQDTTDSESGSGDTTESSAGDRSTSAADGSENPTSSEAASEPAASDGAAQAADGPDASTSDGAETTRPELIGTRWIFEDENGATMRLTFRAEGRIERDGVVARAWSWERSGRSVTISYDSGIGLSSTRRGRLVSPERMRGTGESAGQDSWAWTARRVDS